ncbi:hypothetical protein FGO68_gene9998 [Halteria grandinella]|uniref:Uncharacterized protein n=1 Tax=Halteria grandinella TaxID=5974 RepID=A0A8J8NX62_HALGN|nr:hypothetical protein FGO68_gene9998 [Halteria grandinella]
MLARLGFHSLIEQVHATQLQQQLIPSEKLGLDRPVIALYFSLFSFSCFKSCKKLQSSSSGVIPSSIFFFSFFFQGQSLDGWLLEPQF